MDRRTFLKGLALSAGLLSCGLEELVKEKKPAWHNPNKLLLIGIDGVRPDVLIKATTPNLDRLINTGAYSFKAQAGLHTLSGSCWSNILTGVWDNKHGVIDNTFKGANYEKYPDFFTLIKQVQPKLNAVSVVSWKPLCNQIVAGANSCDYYPYTGQVDEGDYLVAQQAAKILAKGNPDILFTYFAGMDYAGHNYGFHPDVPEYFNKMELIDGLVGTMLNALVNRPTYEKENWLILAITDHGGIGNSHGGQTPEEKTIFYIANGKSAIPGEIIPAPTHVDIVPTALYHLNIPVNPIWGLDGKVAGIR
ncbi:MAG: alkaline phosphatase family protein [Nanoarchaeota archaeon]